jgi:hypothetical protein
VDSTEISATWDGRGSDFGPLLGTVGALACYFFYRSNGSRGAHSPMPDSSEPLQPDPGFAVRRRADRSHHSPRVWLLGVPIMVRLFIWRPSPLLVLMVILAAQVWKAIKFDPARKARTARSSQQAH